MKVSKRKKEHVEIALKKDVRFRNKTSGFEAFDFIHCAVPEMRFEDVDTGVEFLGKSLSFPFMITAMTGGYTGARAINRALAEVCREEHLALGIGSQRQIMENGDHLDTFRIARETAPGAVIIGNIGAAQLAQSRDREAFQRMADLIGADAVAVHLNPLQELLQREGNRDFRGVLKGIGWLVKILKIPVIAKEIGCGISEKAARLLLDEGVVYIDVAGAGGTSWAAIESFRNGKSGHAAAFRDWGIPTAVCLETVSRIPQARIIASGGIENGITIAKALAMGAELTGAAFPILKAHADADPGKLAGLVGDWREQLKMVLFLTGCRNTDELRRSRPLMRIHPPDCRPESSGEPR
ncbi:type 2 isopentenyl-diphosphate Delta-isomerase [bacterium]|nr:type 2 isopentenyl-diphosphate Delta-isomerase [bacterium]